jgi:uncharacterized protein (TIGR02594 family)
MAEYATGTVYTSVTDSWEALQAATGLTRDELKSLNPHLEAVAEIEPGIPIDVPYARRQSMMAAKTPALAAGPGPSAANTPYSIARTELLKNISEIPGSQNNPRITLYHSTTSGGAAPDEVSWCSSFVNYCVEQSGRTGTDSKAARSWNQWGTAVPKSQWQDGDIIVFWRVALSSWEGHVGFLVDWNGSRPHVLAGNQDNKLSIAQPYPFSQILSVRRG